MQGNYEGVALGCGAVSGECCCNTLVFAGIADQLVRQLFDVGLRLDAIGAVFDGDETPAVRLDKTENALAAILAGLDHMIRDMGLAMLSVTVALPEAEPNP
ncbi:hypothetical protein BJY24_007377 [Nocardia transvalensis]|uniref:Uncharacterized protein n=1 Tax=Nocardia transvalensis TaxID=37333 RepID=A0A7W9UN49_9NOCA|nr:hypothetical protein [Nocardia transvalensis]MBB5918465.1 hypothetical protein [Nocardia transvalensis]